MKKLICILVVSVLFVGISLPAMANYADTSSCTFHNNPGGLMSIDVYINGSDKIQLEDIPTEGFLEVYSILGVKVTNVNLKKCVGNCTLNLPKGIYILKAGNVARKIVVR